MSLSANLINRNMKKKRSLRCANLINRNMKKKRSLRNYNTMTREAEVSRKLKRVANSKGQQQISFKKSLPNLQQTTNTQTAVQSLATTSNESFTQKEAEKNYIDDLNLDFGEYLEIIAPNNDEKMRFLTKRFIPDPKFQFPKKLIHGSERSYSQKWIQKYPFLAYSVKHQSVFCVPCSLSLPPERRTNHFTKIPGFSTWSKITELVDKHTKTNIHDDCVQAMDEFKKSREPGQQNNIVTMLDSTRLERIERNRSILRPVIRVIILCGNQNIALRGHRECVRPSKTSSASEDDTARSGNFLAILKLLALYDPILKQHLESPAALNAQYVSPTIQNELIDIIAYDFLQSSILDEIKEAKFFTILADEVESHHHEHLPLCIRFVDKSGDIREEFVEFGLCERVTGEAIAAEIVRLLKKLGLSIENIRGQGYDGASNMSSEARGVQGRIKALNPKAAYTHCCGHNLALTIGDGGKKMNLLREVARQNPHFALNQKVVFDVCVTRWIENLDGYNMMLCALPFIIEMLQVVALKMHLEKYPEWKDWDPTITIPCTFYS